MTYEEEKNYPERKIPMEDGEIPHYHGHTVRQVLFACGIIMLLFLTFFYDEIRFGAFLPLFGILAIDLFAGLTSPRFLLAIFFDVLVSLAGLVYFELSAVFRYQAFHALFDGYFLFAEALAILFFVSLYFSTKSFRGIAVG